MCDGECSNADFQVFKYGKSLAAADEGGTRGENVVDQQNVLPEEVVGAAK